MRKALALGTTAASLAALAVAAAPASAAACTAEQTLTGSCTTVALTVIDGSLSILVTAAAAGTTSPVSSTTGTTADVILGATLVTDTRLSSRGWTAKATSTALEAAAGGANIPVSAHSFFIPSTGTVPGVATLAFPDSTSGPGEAPVASGDNLVTATTTTGPPLAVTYTPTMRVAVPANTAGGVYTGTVIQSVS